MAKKEEVSEQLKLNYAGTHDEGFTKTILKLSSDDSLALLKKKRGYFNSNCPACHSDALCSEFRLSDGFDYDRCKNCRMVFMNPCFTEAMYVEYLEKGAAWAYWRDYMPESMKRSRISMYKERALYVEKMASAHSFPLDSILEVGAGNGETAEFLASFAGVKEVVIIEPQPFKCAHPKIKPVQATMAEACLDKQVDAAVAFEVLEHIIDPDAFLKDIRRHLRRGGMFLFSTPNIEGFETQVLRDRSSSCVFDHSRLYSPLAVRELLTRNGFEIVHLETPGQYDVQMVQRKYLEGEIDFTNNAALKFLMEDGFKYAEEFQAYLRSHQLSGHMRCVARVGA